MQRDRLHVLRVLMHARAVAVLGAALLLGACAGLHAPLDASRVLDDAAFTTSRPLPAVDPEEGVRASEPMQRFVRQDLAPLVRRHGPQRALGMVLQRSGWIEVDYDDTRTRTAAEAFAQRSGNCLSLVMMTAALANEMGLRVYFQEALSAEQWSRRAGLHVASGHVNVTLTKPRPIGPSVSYDSAAALTIDFIPSADAQRQRTRLVSLDTLLAMYANNRAVESMIDGNLPLAYAWGRAAIARDPRFLHAANTLAVIYLRAGHFAAAERTQRDVLARDPVNTRALGNLVSAVRAQGRVDEAEALQHELAAIEPVRPFHYFELGTQALAAGEVTVARELLRKELARDADYHETHHALAQAEARLGNVKEARDHLERAATLSPEGATRSRYIAKLEKLKHAAGVH